MKRSLIKFWMNTPVGKLVFNHDGATTWRMSSTKGNLDSIKVNLHAEDVTAWDVIRTFGWPAHIGMFTPYGQIYVPAEKPKVVKKVQPLVIFHGMGRIWGATIGDDTLIFKSKEDLDAYLEQQDKNDGQN